jgi:hypothetical protein
VRCPRVRDRVGEGSESYRQILVTEEVRRQRFELAL